MSDADRILFLEERATQLGNHRDLLQAQVNDDAARIPTLEARIAELTRAARRFPVMDDTRYSVPWSCVEAFDAQAVANHGQTLEELAARGGLSSVELIAVIEGHDGRWAGANWKTPGPRARVFELLGLDATGHPSAAARIAELQAELTRLRTLRPRETYHEDDGAVLWWRVPVVEPPHPGWPSEDDFPEDYFTHWTPIPNPEDLDE